MWRINMAKTTIQTGNTGELQGSTAVTRDLSIINSSISSITKVSELRKLPELATLIPQENQEDFLRNVNTLFRKTLISFIDPVLSLYCEDSRLEIDEDGAELNKLLGEVRNFAQKCGIKISLLFKMQFKALHDIEQVFLVKAFTDGLDIREFSPFKKIDGYDLPVVLKNIAALNKFTTIGELTSFAYENRDSLAILIKSEQEDIALTQSDLELIDSLFLKFCEAEILKRAGCDLQELSEDKSRIRLSQALIDEKVWFNYEVRENFIKGVAAFGAAPFLNYINARGHSRLNVLENIDDIIELYKLTELTKNEFCHQLLSQIAFDPTLYPHGKAQMLFNYLNSVKFYNSYEKLREIAISNSEDPFASIFLNEYDKLGDICKSWRGFIRFHELALHLFDLEYSKLKIELNGEQKVFIDGLTSYQRVNISSVVKFIASPKEFFADSDLEIPTTLREFLNPLELCKIAHSELSPENLRDLYSSNKLNQYSSLPSLSVEYLIDDIQNLSYTSTLSSRLRSHLDTLKQRNQKEARAFFKLINSICQNYNVNLQSFLHEQNNSQLDPKFEAVVDQLLPANNPELKIKLTVCTKTEPRGLAAPSYSNSCNQFGSEKGNIATLLPNTQILTIEIAGQDEEYTLIGHSLLTRDANLDISLVELYQELCRENPRVKMFLQNYNFARKDKLRGDNLEIAKNYSDKAEIIQVIERVLPDFFRIYLGLYGDSHNLESETVNIGNCYSPALKFPLEAPSGFWRANIAYTDRGKKESELKEVGDYRLYLNTYSRDKFCRKILHQDSDTTNRFGLHSPLGQVSELTVMDSIGVWKVQEMAYSSNLELIDHPLELQSVLNNNDLASLSSGNENLSLKFIDRNGDMLSYLIAYLGTLDPEQFNNQDRVAELAGKPIIYIADFASISRNPWHVSTVLKAFWDKYCKLYQSLKIPILLEAREQTSARIIRQLEKSFTAKVTVHTLEKESREGETFTSYLIQPQ